MATPLCRRGRSPRHPGGRSISTLEQLRDRYRHQLQTLLLERRPPTPVQEYAEALEAEVERVTTAWDESTARVQRLLLQIRAQDSEIGRLMKVVKDQRTPNDNPTGTWGHRVVCDDQEGHRIAEVYTLHDGNIAWTADPIAPWGNTFEEVRDDLVRMLRALDQPVLVEADLEVLAAKGTQEATVAEPEEAKEHWFTTTFKFHISAENKEDAKAEFESLERYITEDYLRWYDPWSFTWGPVEEDSD